MNLKTPNFKLEFWNSRLKDLINSYLSKLKVFELQGMRLSEFSRTVHWIIIIPESSKVKYQVKNT